jgi:hypothetical protein
MNSADRSGAIGLAFDLFGKLSCFHEQMLFERFAALPIDTGCFILGGHLAGGRVKVQLGVNFVNQRVPFASSHFVF